MTRVPVKLIIMTFLIYRVKELIVLFKCNKYQGVESYQTSLSGLIFGDEKRFKTAINRNAMRVSFCCNPVKTNGLNNFKTLNKKVRFFLVKLFHSQLYNTFIRPFYLKGAKFVSTPIIA